MAAGRLWRETPRPGDLLTFHFLVLHSLVWKVCHEHCEVARPVWVAEFAGGSQLGRPDKQRREEPRAFARPARGCGVSRRSRTCAGDLPQAWLIQATLTLLPWPLQPRGPGPDGRQCSWLTQRGRSSRRDSGGLRESSSTVGAGGAAFLRQVEMPREKGPGTTSRS